VGDAVTLVIDLVRRRSVNANHSATHLLHAALRNVLGSHVAQKGSLVAPDRLRFDFSHPKPLDAHEVEAVEDLANTVVLEDAPVVTRLMDRDEAMKSGAMALFGEKYGDEVRVVSMGTMPGGVPDKTYSVELCGGTHVGRTGEIGLMTVVSEGAVAAGVRRIEALTGAAARKHLADQEKRLRAAAMALKVRPEEVAERVEVLVEERRKLERDLAEARKKLAMGGGASAGGEATQIVDVGGIKYFRLAVSDVGMNDLKALADEGKARVASGVVAIANTTSEGKGSLVVGVTSDLTGRFSAIDLVRKGAEALGGKGGGGRPDLAQAGGPDGAKAEKALAAIQSAIAGG
jgi:alanyl-tRNA synthetase